jgi:hypothetical protein
MKKYLKINVTYSQDLVNDLKGFGYTPRSGSGAYVRNVLCIIPAKKWYWRANEELGTSEISL